MKYLYTAVALLLTMTAQGQSDSVRTEYKTEDEKISSTEVKRFIRYLTRANVEEKTLIKVGIWPGNIKQTTGIYRTTQLIMNVFASVEHKISPGISVLVGLKNSMAYVTSRSPLTLNPMTGTVEQKSYGTGVSASVGVRYYYAMRKHIRAGKSANNFSGNYLGSHVNQTVYLYQYARSYNYQSQTYRVNETKGSDTPYTPSIDVVYGLQRRLWRRGYADINAGPRLVFSNPTSRVISERGASVTLQISAQIGLGW
ncbi:MAG: hypothetical protein H7Z72_22135 [Bacteroidetes bacterium]|nr:hypothetical protein [Fibrella sp.]